MAILYVASEARELAHFASLLANPRKLKWPVAYAWEGMWEGRRIFLAANGAGPKLAYHAVEIAIRAMSMAELSASRLEAVVSTGYCGALDPALGDAQIVVGTQVTDAASNETFGCAGVESDAPFISGRILTQDRIAITAAEKAQLATTGAIAVDMESAGAAARAQRAGLPFAVIRAVSDRADDSFAFDLNRMRTAEGRIANGKIITYALTHPGIISELLRLRRKANNASRALGEFLACSRIRPTPEEPAAE
jgi:adenosylhomocysteine nucleosidase